MATTTDAVLVSLAGTHIFYHRGDQAFSHVCLDPREGNPAVRSSRHLEGWRGRSGKGMAASRRGGV